MQYQQDETFSKVTNEHKKALEVCYISGDKIIGWIKSHCKIPMSHRKKPFLRSLKYAGKKPSKKKYSDKEQPSQRQAKKKSKRKNLTRVEDCVICE